MLRGHTWSTSLFRIFTFPEGLFPWPSLAQSGTSYCIVGHKNTGCSWFALISPVICIFSGLADYLLTSVRSAVVVSCSKIPIIFLISHNLCSFPQHRVVLRNMFTLSVCLIKHVIIFELGLSKFHEMWIMSGNENICSEARHKEWGRHVFSARKNVRERVN